jgi:hypothetical protein
MAEQKTFSVRVTYSVRVTVAAEPAALTVEVWREEGREGVRLSAGALAVMLEQGSVDTGEVWRTVERVAWHAFGSRNSPSRLGI